MDKARMQFRNRLLNTPCVCGVDIGRVCNRFVSNGDTFCEQRVLDAHATFVNHQYDMEGRFKKWLRRWLLGN